MLKYSIDLIQRLIVEEDGPTAVEYAVMIMMIFLACLATVQLVGTSANESFKYSSDSIETAITNANS